MSNSCHEVSMRGGGFARIFFFEPLSKKFLGHKSLFSNSNFRLQEYYLFY